MALGDQERSTLMITHELSHNWFGNEATLEWWTYLWLNEGFARFFEYYLGDQVIYCINAQLYGRILRNHFQIEPSWHLLDDFVLTNTQSVLRIDDNALVRPMSTYIADPKLLNSLNDCVNYEKGTCTAIATDLFQIKLLFFSFFCYTNDEPYVWH